MPRNAAMIRLPPTTIVLGRSDLKEFERHRQCRREVENLNQDRSRFAVGIHIPHAQEVEDSQPLQTGGGHDAGHRARHLTLQTSIPQSIQTTASPEHEESRLLGSPCSSSTTEDEYPTTIDVQDVHDEHNHVYVRSENPARNSQRSPPPSKGDFYYGGFVESPTGRTLDTTPNRSCSFGMLLTSKSGPFLISAAPEDISTPQNIQLPDTSRLRNRVPLPRSPLFLSHNASSSPEHRPTSGLTPRVAARMTSHNTPGIMFAQPARRMRRQPPRTFRHQANSFSFDSSERASAAYEQERVSSTSTDDSAPRPSDELSLHEELRGSSLQSLRVTSGLSYALLDPLVEGFSTVRIRDESDEVVPTERDFSFSPPQLSLPPPFSSVPRNVSGAESLPGIEYIPHPPTSPIRSISNTPIRSGAEGRRPSPNSSRTVLEQVGEEDLSLPFANGISPRSLMRRAADSVGGFYRARTPLSRHGSPNHPSPSTSTSPTPRRGLGRHASTELGPRTPSRTYQVYNDGLPSSSQPQTPAHLPEARHQSRFHPSYTAPVTRGAARRASRPVTRIDNGDRERLGLERPQQLYTPLRRGAGRSASPMGMLRDGFSGLYGGRENGDEEHNWAEGVRFSYAETRLWGLRDARNDGTSLRETPEPEDWRVSRSD